MQIYWVGPIAGGVLSAIVYKVVINPYRGVLNMDEAISKLSEFMIFFFFYDLVVQY